MQTTFLRILFTLLCLPMCLTAQIDMNAPVPLDPSVRVGTLSNGIKYYIQKNAKPQNRAQLRLALNAGAMQENENQRGLAHFCEHMCFNGTAHFPKNDLVNYLESIGTKFGAHLNAYTSFDETVYMLQVPTEKADFIEKGLLVLQDWAMGVSFEDAEIDKERGVVISERRNGLGADSRMFDKTFPIQMKDSRYAERLPIGTLEVLEKFDYETLRSFYKDWYRPDLMAVMAVGDFEVDQMEKNIKATFEQIPAAKNPRLREYYPVPDHKETLVAIATDKEAERNSVEVQFNHSVLEAKTQADVRRDLMLSLISNMINQRFNEIAQAPNAPMTWGWAYFGNMIRTKAAFSANWMMANDDVMGSLEKLLMEIERVKQHGFIAEELILAKKELINNFTSTYENRANKESDRIIRSLVNSYLKNTPFPSEEWKYKFNMNEIEKIQLEELNKLVQEWITNGENEVITVQMQEKAGAKIPTEADIQALIAKVKTQKMPKYRLVLADKPLLAEIPKSGKVLTEKLLKEIGATEITFLNGAKVILKPTDFHNDQVLFSAFSKGGSSLYDIKDENNANNAGAIVSMSGLGPYNQIELGRYLMGKKVSISPYIWEGGERLGGDAGAKDLETTLQMLYLYFTQPKIDKAGFDNFLAEQKMFMGNKNLNPDMVLADTVGAVLANYHPRRLPTQYEDLTKIDTKRALEIYKERFNAGDFTFIFVGKFNVEEVKRWTSMYIGGIPATEKKESFKDLGIPMAKGEIKRTVYKGTEPKSTVKLVFRTENAKNDRQSRLIHNALVQVLNIKLREMIREEKGGTYGVRVSGAINSYPKLYSSINVEFGCDPGRSEELANAAIAVIQKIQKEGVKEEDLKKVKETRRRELETSFKENRYWLNMISNAYEENLSIADLASFETLYQFTENISLENIQRASMQYMNLKDYAKFILLPEKK